jgi:raffinose/stachyose/melibiose transport system substrate-binding protein
MFWQNAFALRAAGAQACQDALSGKASFDQPAFVESAAKLKALVDLKAFNDGCMGLSYDEGNAVFLQGKVPMYFMGNWFAGNIAGDDSLIKDKVVCKKFPVLADGKGTANEYLGGAIDGFCVSKDSKVKDAAVKVAKYFAEEMAKELASTGDGLPTWNVPAGSGQINPITQQIMDLSKDANGFVLAWDTFLEGADAEKHKDLVAELYGKKIAPANFAKEMQKLNEN